MEQQEVVLPASVLRALERMTFFDRHAARDEKLRVMAQLPVAGVLPWIAGDPKADEVALMKAFPTLSADQLKLAAEALQGLFRDHLRLLRARRRHAGGWVQNW